MNSFSLEFIVCIVAAYIVLSLYLQVSLSL